jgi:hypothetical protein
MQPEHWDGQTHAAKVQGSAPHGITNPHLNRASEAAFDAQALVTQYGRKLPEKNSMFSTAPCTCI